MGTSEKFAEKYCFYADWGQAPGFEDASDRLLQTLLRLRETSAWFDDWLELTESGPEEVSLTKAEIERLVDEGDLWRDKVPQRTGQAWTVNLRKRIKSGRALKLSFKLGDVAGLGMVMKVPKGVLDQTHRVYQAELGRSVLKIVADVWEPDWCCWTTFEHFDYLDEDGGFDELRSGPLDSLDVRVGWLNYFGLVNSATALEKAKRVFGETNEVEQTSGGLLVQAADHPLLGSRDDDLETGRQLLRQVIRAGDAVRAFS